jgi:hypothetical protein
MRSWLVVAALLVPALARAQSQTFDLITYTPPKGWTLDTIKTGRVYTHVDQAAGTYCRVSLYTSVPTLGNARADFDAEWKDLVAAFYPGIRAPVVGTPKAAGAWVLQGGGTEHEIVGKPTKVLQFTLSGPQRRLSLVTLSTGDCEAEFGALVASIRLAPAAPAILGAKPPPPGVEAIPSGPAAPASAPAVNGGWTSVAKEDWVEVTNGALSVYLHYPNAKADAYNSVLRAGLQNAWNVLVAPHYTQVRNFALKPIQSYESISFAEADAIDRANRPVHVVLFKKHDSQALNRYLEFVAPDKATFERQFGPYRNEEFGWDALVNMGRYNAFPLTMADLTGTWSSTDFASISYYYVSTGGLAGTNATSLADSFTFDGKGGYSSDHSGASGAVGNAKFSRQQYRGAASISPEGLTLTNRFQGQSETYSAFFQAVKGGRVLVLTDRLKTTKYLVRPR